jgi:alkylation response protein AidB-like acyl-CoA dehydrogenase
MPEEYGGAGGSFAHEAVIIDQLGKRGVDGWGIILHNAIVAPYILHYGSEEQKKKWLPRLASGELVGAIAMTEPGTGSDLQSVKTTARRDGNQYLVNGSKTFITNGGTANFIIVVSKTDTTKGAKGISLVCVETDEVEGFRRGRVLDKLGQKANDTAELFFDDVRVPTSNLIGIDEGMGFVQLMQQLPQERLIIALQALAVIERALEVTTDLRQGAPRLRQADDRIPEHAVQARRMQDRSDHRQGVLSALHRSASARQARRDHGVDGQALAYRHAMQNRRRVPAAAWRLWLHERISHRAHVCRQPRAENLRRHQRNHEAVDRAKPLRAALFRNSRR